MTLVKVNNPAAKSFDGLLNDLFYEFPTNWGRSIKNQALGFPPVNIVEKADNYQVEISAPGFDKADFNVKLDNNLLTISAEKKEETKSETDKVVRKEFSSKSFSRSFTIDEKINGEGIAANYENGILKLQLPKKEEVKAAAKQIAIQ